MKPDVLKQFAWFHNSSNVSDEITYPIRYYTA